MAIARTITNNGLKELTKLHAKILDPMVAGRPFSHIGIGKGTATPMITDVGLQDEIRMDQMHPSGEAAAVILDPAQTGDLT